MHDRSEQANSAPHSAAVRQPGPELMTAERGRDARLSARKRPGGSQASQSAGRCHQHASSARQAYSARRKPAVAWGLISWRGELTLPLKGFDPDEALKTFSVSCLTIVTSTHLRFAAINYRGPGTTLSTTSTPRQASKFQIPNSQPQILVFLALFQR